MEDLMPLVLTAIICLVVGGIVGVLVMKLREPEENNRGRARNMDEVMRIWRQRGTKKLTVEVERRDYQDSGDMSVTMHARLLRTLQDLQHWLDAPMVEAGLTKPATPTPQPSELDQGTVQVFKDETASKVFLPEQPEGVSKPVPLPATESVLSELEEEPQDKKRANMNPIDVLVRAIKTDVSKVETRWSLAAQVDEILQEKLESSPLKERAIRLLELPEKGMVVLVGLEQYDGVNSVPYPEIRELLQECVAEWEERTEKGDSRRANLS